MREEDWLATAGKPPTLLFTEMLSQHFRLLHYAEKQKSQAPSVASTNSLMMSNRLSSQC